jgi:hypothetical protein
MGNINPAAAGQRLPIKDVVADLGNPGLAAPARRQASGVERHGARRHFVPHVVNGNAGNALSGLPVATRSRGAAVIEAELAPLLDDAADAAGIAARFDAVDDRLGDGKLAFERFTARFEIDRGGKACLLYTSPSPRDH